VIRLSSGGVLTTIIVIWTENAHTATAWLRCPNRAAGRGGEGRFAFGRLRFGRRRHHWHRCLAAGAEAASVSAVSLSRFSASCPDASVSRQWIICVRSVFTLFIRTPHRICVFLCARALVCFKVLNRINIHIFPLQAVVRVWCARLLVVGSFCARAYSR